MGLVIPWLVFWTIVAIGCGLFVVAVLGLVFDAIRCLYLGLTRKPRRFEE